MHHQGPGYGPPHQPQHPGYYAPPVSAHDPNKVTATDIILPVLLSLFCGIGGFVWGMVRMVQGHQKPGWVAMGINAGIWALGLVVWATLTALIFGAAAASVPPTTTP